MRFNKLNLTKLKPEVLFALFSSLFGLMILLITPPFQTPDEINHFYKAYQISEGCLISVKHDNRIGGYLPKSLKTSTEPFLDLIGNMHAKTNHKTIINQFKTPLEPDNKIFMDFPNTGMYSPISYVPQGISIFALRQLHLPPLYIFYGARFFTLLFWIVSIFYAIRIIPTYKWLFTIIALLPMSLSVNMSLSADVVTNALSFILIAYILNLAFSKQAISTNNFIIILLLAIALASAKLVYTPILLLFLIIPKEKFYSKKYYYFQIIALLIISLGTALFWAKIMNGLYVPYGLYNKQFRDTATLISCADMHAQLQFILSHGLYLWHVFVNSMIHSFDMYYQGYIGTFGWLDTKLPMWIINSSYAILLFTALTDNNKAIKIELRHKLILLFSAFIILCLILLTQHLTWDCVGGDIIFTIQGRYFIPVFPLLFMMFYTQRLNFSKFAIPVIIVFSFISLSFTINKLYSRYFVKPKFKTISIRCNAEVVENERFFVTNLPNILFANAETQNKEQARNGIYSAKLTPQNQFGFTYRLNNCGLGDILNIEVWRLGKQGGIIISATNDFYISKFETTEIDSAGWELIQLKYTVPKNMNNKEITIYLYNNSNASSYFDDLIISHSKLQ